LSIKINPAQNVGTSVEYSELGNDVLYRLAPIGTVLAWLKSYPNTPSLPAGWVECNGQVLNDSESPYDGQTIPDLNGATGGLKRFLRGSTTSGTTGGSEQHNHGAGTEYNAGAVYTPSRYANANHLPPYYEVVWIMRVK